MRRIYTLIFFVSMVFIINTSVAQTIYENAQDGKLYFMIKKDAAKNIVWKSNKVDINQTQFLREINKNHSLNDVDLAFHLDKSSEALNRIFKVQFENPSEIDQLIKAFETCDLIEYAERVPLYKTFHTPNDPNYTTTAWGYNWNWHLDLINAEQAWDISTGDPNIKVAVVDGAIWSSHPDLQNKIVAQYYGTSFPAYNSNPPTSISQSSSLSAYDWSHGTHCAGLIAAETNNSTGIAAIGYNVSLMAARSADNNGDLYYTSQGVTWASNNGANVISMSYGGTSYSASENTLMTNLKNNGIVLVAAAGNEGDEGNEVNYPAGYDAVISVGSVNNDLELSYFSQHGNWVDIAAPGGFNGPINVLSTTYTEAYYLEQVSQFTETYYDGMQGTSMATPIVSGLCGLLLSIDPSLTPDEVKACLMDNAQTIASSGNQINPASGCIDAYASAQCAQGSSPTNYCASSGSLQYATSITLVNFGSINKATGQTNAYEDYTNLSTDVVKNSSYDLTVNVNTDGNYTIHSMVWIDWNQDFDFDDAGEEYILGTAYGTTNGASSASPYSITIPDGATLGLTRMRVSAKYDSQATACEEGYDGEVEDYTLNITAESTVAVNENLRNNGFKIYPKPSNGVLTVELNDTEKSEIYIYNLNGNLVKSAIQTKKEQTYDLSTLAKSVYFIKIVNNNNTYTQKLILE